MLAEKYILGLSTDDHNVRAVTRMHHRSRHRLADTCCRGPPTEQRHIRDAIFRLLARNQTPAWREVYVKILDGLISRHLAFWGAYL